MESPKTLPVPQHIMESVTSHLNEALAQVTIAEDFKIANASDAQVCGEQLSAIVKVRKTVEAERKAETDPLHQLKTTIIATYKPVDDKLDMAERLLRAELKRYTEAEEKKARDAQAAADEAARKEREANEAALRKEQERLASLKTPEARAKAEEKIEQLEAKADDADINRAIVEAPQKIAGFGLADNWKAVIDDDTLEALVLAAAGVDKLVRPDLLAYLTVDDKALNKQAKATKAKTVIPGVRVVNDRSTRVR